MKILMTGGAGFIGSHVADALLEAGHHVRVFDNLSPQVHGTAQDRPAYLHPDVEFIRDDIRHADAVAAALSGMDAVYHLAAMVGVGQSMYRIADYTAANQLGTAVLLEAIAQQPVKRLIVASSGIAELADWLQGQVATDRVGEAHAELAARGLTI